MKKLNKILLLAFISIGLFSCDPETRSQDPDDIGSTDYKPSLSVTADTPAGDISEGTTVTYSLSLDKPHYFDIEFKATLVGGTANKNDVVLGSGTVAAYATTGSLTVTFVDDLLPEVDETAQIRIEAGDFSYDFWLQENANSASYSYNIISPVDPDGLFVGLEWESDADLDMFAVSATAGAWSEQWTGDNPEVKRLINNTDPDGTYYLGVDPYEIEEGVTTFSYKWSFGSPDGTITTVEGMFDYENRDTLYTIDNGTGGTASYRLVTVVKTGSSYTVTGI